MIIPSASGVSEELERALYDRLSVCRLGNSLAKVVMMGSLVRDVLSESALEMSMRSLRLQPSRSSSSRHGRKPLVLIEPLGRAKLRTIRRIAKIRTRNVLANGLRRWSTMVT